MLLRGSTPRHLFHSFLEPNVIGSFLKVFTLLLRMNCLSVFMWSGLTCSLNRTPPALSYPSKRHEQSQKPPSSQLCPKSFLRPVWAAHRLSAKPHWSLIIGKIPTVGSPLDSKTSSRGPSDLPCQRLSAAGPIFCRPNCFQPSVDQGEVTLHVDLLPQCVDSFQRLVQSC